MTVVVSLCAFVLALLGSRIIILAMRQRRRQLGYDRLPPGTPGAPPYSIQDGGIVLVFAVLICMSVMYLRYEILLSLLILTAVYSLRKLLPLPWVVQLIVQILAVVLAIHSYPGLTFGGLFVPWLDVLITGALWLLFVHMFSSMDQLDGLCASGVITIGLGLAFIIAMAGKFPDLLSGYSLIAASAACGFFWWNRPPAKISMGKIGSVPMGFLLAYLLFAAVRNDYVFPALILPAYFVTDYIAAWVKRTWKNQPLKQRHADYGYLAPLKNGRSERFVVRSIMGMNLLVAFMASHAQLQPDLAVFHLLLAYASVFMLLKFFSQPNKKEKIP